MLACIFEDRPAALIGVKLLVLSLQRHCPGLEVAVHCPAADAGLRRFLSGRPGVELHVEPALAGQGWNTKPLLLSRGLDSGYDAVVWLDSDVIAAGDFRPRLERHPPAAVVGGQEQYWGLHQGGTIRARLWGLEPGRPLPWTINSGCVRVTPAHRELLAAWSRLLEDSEYRAAQRIEPMYARPIHQQGDQDVLTALLGSRRFEHLPVAYLRRGVDIVQGIGPAGYALHERIARLLRGGGLPPLIHGVHPKPWAAAPAGGGLMDRVRSHHDRMYLELSPYAYAARPYLDELGEDAPSLRIRTAGGRICHALSAGSPALAGLPQAIVHSLGKRAKRLAGKTPWRNVEAIARQVTGRHGERVLDELFSRDNARRAPHGPCAAEAAP